jgi:hypothetical protein
MPNKGAVKRKKKVKTVLYLYEDQMRILKRFAHDLDEPMSKLIRQGLDAFILTLKKRHKK